MTIVLNNLSIINLGLLVIFILYDFSTSHKLSVFFSSPTITYLKISTSEDSMVFVTNLSSFIEKNLILVLPCVMQAR
jgi:hypothetical protein